MSTAVVTERIESTKGMNGKPLNFAMYKLLLQEVENCNHFISFLY